MTPIIELKSVGVTEALVRNDARIARLETGIEPALMEGTHNFYDSVRGWYDSQGEGSWPPLAPSTIARKYAEGYSDPQKPLYAEGNLEASSTSASGPYSFLHPVPDGILLGVDWSVGGYQIPVVHFYGTQTAGRNHTTVIPARPIWPDQFSHAHVRIIEGFLEWLKKLAM